MGVELTLNVGALRDSLPAETLQTLQTEGVKQGLRFVFLTQDDDHVRPQHRALHGTVWDADDPNAPAPPLDYGCRCRVSYLAEPDTPAAEVLPESTVEPVTPAEAYGTWLDSNVDGWQSAADSVKGAAPAQWPSLLTVALQRLHPTATLSAVRAWVDMIIKARLAPIGG